MNRPVDVQIDVTRALNEQLVGLRTRYRDEAHTQIVHDSLHNRPGWTEGYLLQIDGHPAGLASIAIAGPWQDRPTIYEYYLLPEFRQHAFAVFEQFQRVSGGRFFEVQTSDELLAVMLHTYGHQIATEKIVFRDLLTTHHTVPGAKLVWETDRPLIEQAMHERRGGGEWKLTLHAQPVGKGGLLFHYNPPYGDIWMEIEEPYRRQGLGSYLVQEIKQIAYQLGAIPAARCNFDNIASRRTLQRAGFVPYASILLGEVAASSA
ncbi:MAG: GNAT family N-acetyltransferase [Pirellulales bacterium]